MANTFADNLKSCLDRHNFTDKELAKSLNCNLRTVRCWLSGRYVPTIRKILTICTIIGASLDELISDNNYSDYENDPFVYELFSILQDLQFENYYYVKAPINSFVNAIKKMNGDDNNA